VSRDDIPLVSLANVTWKYWSAKFPTRHDNCGYPVASHDTVPKAPISPHLVYDISQPLIGGSTILALHANFKHLD
jgi:hypothetical protein